LKVLRILLVVGSVSALLLVTTVRIAIARKDEVVFFYALVLGGPLCLLLLGPGVVGGWLLLATRHEPAGRRDLVLLLGATAILALTPILLL
jgi:hypothetical protein